MEKTAARQSVSVRSFITVMGRMPANLVGAFHPGTLGCMEVRRVIQAVKQLGGEMLFHDGAAPADVKFPDDPMGEEIILRNQRLRVLRVQFYRSQLPPFSHIFLFMREEGKVEERILILVPKDSPLLVTSGLRLLGKHLFNTRHPDVTAYHNELDGLATMIRQGNPLEALGGGE